MGSRPFAPRPNRRTLPNLKEFPSVDQVLKAETTRDPKQTAVLQLTALAELKELVKVLAGDRQYRDLTQDEGRLMQSYANAFNKITTDSDRTWPGPQGKWRRFSLNINDHYYPYNDPRFGSDTLLFQKLLPPDIRTRLEQELTLEGQVHEAFVKMQGEQDARVNAQTQADAASSPLNTAPLTEILMMKDGTPARRCLELGHSPMECTVKGFVGMLGGLGANIGQSHMKPGLSMSGIYKSRDGRCLISTAKASPLVVAASWSPPVTVTCSAERASRLFSKFPVQHNPSVSRWGPMGTSEDLEQLRWTVRLL